MLRKKIHFLFLFFFISENSMAGFISGIDFSADEIKFHKENIDSLTIEAAQCIKHDLHRHQEFFKKYGVSSFYGENSAFSRLSEKEKRNFLIEKKLDPGLLSEISATSCVGLTLKCLEKGFKITGQEEIYKKLKAFVVVNGVDGTALQHGLGKLNWKTLYWNPSPSKNKFWDLEEKLVDIKNKKHFRGFHQDNYVAAITKKRYFMNSVDDVVSLVDFKENEPELLKTIPFFVGTAHMGYHVFPGTYGLVIEGHSTRALTDERTIESAPFNPLSNAGAPSGHYRSGIISIPPQI